MASWTAYYKSEELPPSGQLCQLEARSSSASPLDSLAETRRRGNRHLMQPFDLLPMPGNADSIFHTTNLRRNRSKIARRKRVPLLPIVRDASKEFSSRKSSVFPSNFYSSAYFTGEVSGESSMISVASVNPKKRQRPKENEVVERSISEFTSGYSRPVTRSYSRRKDNARSDENKVSSCTGSFSPEKKRKCSRSDVYSTRNSKQSIRSLEGISEAETDEEMSCIEQRLPENFNPRSGRREGNEVALQGDVVAASAGFSVDLSDTSCLESLSASNALNEAKTEPGIAVSESTVDLACSEELSSEDDSPEYSSCPDMTLSQFEAELFPKNQDGEYVDFSQPSISSILGESSDDSERACGNSTPPVWFPLFSQYMREFSWSRSCRQQQAAGGIEDEYSDEFTLMRFENDDYEESFKIFRIRERRHECRLDYAKEYGPTTKYGTLVLQQRLQMVDWMVEHANTHQLHYETLFLGVSLLDRFLSRGFFKSKKKLQLLGISCCTLARRIEENQPFNSVSERQFQVGSNIFARSEVVAMEWLVQHILKFQCFPPTIYNFLWFYLHAARADSEVQECAKYLALLSLLDHDRLCYWPSTVAAGLVILASLAAEHESSCQWVMETHVRTKSDDLPECIQSLEWLVKYVC